MEWEGVVRTGKIVLELARTRPHPAAINSLQVPVEMSVLSSQPFFMQSGIVDATQFGNIPAASFRSTKFFLSQGEVMTEQSVRLGPREQQIVELLLQGCDNAEIATQLKMARRTVKAHFNRLFLRFGITGGIKRVKLATLLYRRQLCLQTNVTETVSQASASTASSSLSPRV
jgi:DNA-binding NarL/FixJ family response regulator